MRTEDNLEVEAVILELAEVGHDEQECSGQ